MSNRNKMFKCSNVMWYGRVAISLGKSELSTHARNSSRWPMRSLRASRALHCNNNHCSVSIVLLCILLLLWGQCVSPLSFLLFLGSAPASLTSSRLLARYCLWELLLDQLCTMLTTVHCWPFVLNCQNQATLAYSTPITAKCTFDHSDKVHWKWMPAWCRCSPRPCTLSLAALGPLTGLQCTVGSMQFYFALIKLKLYFVDAVFEFTQLVYTAWLWFMGECCAELNCRPDVPTCFALLQVLRWQVPKFLPPLFCHFKRPFVGFLVLGS